MFWILESGVFFRVFWAKGVLGSGVRSSSGYFWAKGVLDSGVRSSSERVVKRFLFPGWKQGSFFRARSEQDSQGFLSRAKLRQGQVLLSVEEVKVFFYRARFFLSFQRQGQGLRY